MTPLVLVEGTSDAAVVAVLLRRRGIDPDLVDVVATGGAMGAERTVAALPERPSRILALCDEQEAPHMARALRGADDELLLCRPDLEAELIAALGVEGVLAVLAATADLRSFRILQSQPEHRGRPEVAQLRRFIAAGSGRKARIDAALAAAVPDAAVPSPLADLIDRVEVALGG